MQHRSPNIRFGPKHSTKVKGKENKNCPILQDVDIDEATSTVHGCEELIGNVSSRPKLSLSIFNEDSCFNTETTTGKKSAEIIQLAATTTEAA